MINTYKVQDGWVVSDGGTWLPGVFDSKETAKKAALLSDDKLEELTQKINIDEARSINMEDLLND